MFYKHLDFGLLAHILSFIWDEEFISCTMGTSALWRTWRHYEAFYTHCFVAVVQIDGWELEEANRRAAHACWLQCEGYPPRPKIEECRQVEERPSSLSSIAAPRWAGRP